MTRLKQILVWAWALAASAALASPTCEDWLANEAPVARVRLIKNISPANGRPGAVMASPSVTRPEYYYHWVRDAALTMNEVVTLAAQSSGTEREFFLTYLKDYARFSRLNQMAPTLSGGPGDTGLGEPKFWMDGRPYDLNWGRPQNDGPALRAATLIRFGYLLLATGDDTFVREALYDGRIPAFTVIKADLEFTAHHWRDPSVDLWEEIKGQHFYTRMVQRRALVEGAIFARRMGDEGAARFYESQVPLIEAEINQHWQSDRGYILATVETQRPGFKPSELDIAVVLASLHGHTPSAPFFGPGDDRILATAERLRDAFATLYKVNQTERDGHRDVPLQPGIGRYPEDIYDGLGTSLGNPWYLTTAAMAELAFDVRADLSGQSSLQITSRNHDYFSTALRLKIPEAKLTQGEVIAGRDPRFAGIVAGLAVLGEGYINRIRYHAPADGSLAEEFHRDSGFARGATHLTWSYAAILSAMEARRRHE